VAFELFIFDKFDNNNKRNSVNMTTVLMLTVNLYNTTLVLN